MKIKKSKQISIRIITIALFVCILAGLFYSVGFRSNVMVWAEEPEQTYDINSVDDFINYSKAYARGDRNKKDVLNISINSGSDISGFGYISLGTSSRPFAGTLNITSIGKDIFRLFDCPLFNYVSTDLTINEGGVVKIMREQITQTPPDGILTGGALFANHVVKGEGAANWAISLLAFDNNGDVDRSASESFECLFGDIAADATVTVSFTNASDMAVSGTGNVGLICGTLNAGATLNVTTAGSGSALSVSTTGGHAGGLVGKMENGSTLTLNSANLSRVSSVSTTMSSKYAGGLVGYADRVTIDFDEDLSDYTVSGTVSGKEGAGGLFGYYHSTNASATFDLEKLSLASGMSVSATTYVGGVFGLLENEGASFIFGGNASAATPEVFSVSLPGGTSRGGLAGAYKTNALSNTLTIRDFKPTVSTAASETGYSAGLIGKIVGENAAYILVDGATDSKPIEVTVTGSANGGLVGDIGSKGSFVDVTGTVKVTGTCSAGLISKMQEGVLRIQGTTNLSGFVAADGGATFVKERGRALVYALGDGKGTNGNWTLLRNLNNAVDDIGSWGQVLRTDGTILAEGDLFTVAAGHTVTLKGAQTTMDTITKFALIALNIQLNTGDAAVGALQFTAGSANQSETLLGGTLTLDADLSLSGTGLTGLTRDSGDLNKVLIFKGTFNGGGHTLTLAHGEPYGLAGSAGAALDVDSKQGNIYTHLYNGLFAKLGTSTVSNLTISGTYLVNQTGDNIRLGGIAAQATGTATLTDVDVNYTLNFKSGDRTAYFGGVIGEVAAGASVSIDSGANGIKPTVNDNNSNSITGNTSSTLVGGAIGYMATSSTAQSVTFKTGSTIGLTYTKANKNARTSVFGAAIASVANTAYVKDRRTITFENAVAVEITANGASGSGKKFGGILGCDWYAADVTVNHIDVTSSITANANADFGGLVQTATGHWMLNSIDLDSATFNLPGGTFGLVANKAYISTSAASSALYLDVNDANYNIGALTFTDSPAFTTYDEIVANSKGSGSSIVDNGNAVISITTSGNVIDITGSDYNTYLNKTAYGRAAAKAINGNTRYYYNLAYARANTATAKYKFLVWSVRQYAHSSLSAWFATDDNTFTGDLDMTGLSYYPVDLTNNVTFNNATIKLDNNTMEDAVKYAYYYNNGGLQSSDKRTTRTTGNQHYRMHTAVFRNVTAGITISGSGNTIQGNVPKLSDSFCGFFIAGTLGGADGKTTNLNAQNLVFDDVYVSNSGSQFTDTTYAPLFINKVGKSTTLTIAGARQNGYSAYTSGDKYAGSSLIGDVGASDARGIYLTFSGLKFDSRTSANNLGNLNTAYFGDSVNNHKAIFSRATILNSFLYEKESSGSYNYAIELDHTDATTHIHNVTYGKEITTSAENAGKQERYYGSEYYTDPVTFEADSAYDFSTGFLPYVYVAYDLGEYKHELSVNVTYNSVIEGCGKYGDPYIIDDDEKLPIISQIINGEDVGNTVQIELPDDLLDFVYTGSISKHLYNFGTSNFTSSNGGTARSNANVRKYLAGAYYVITKDITLPNDYAALGMVSDAQYAFRGVLIGRGTPTVTNKSPNPLVYTSLGCVVKDLVIDVDVDYNSTNIISLAAPTGSSTYALSGGNDTYGAVIRQILGGDTILDGVQVTFTNAVFNITKASSSNYERLVPIGGYVGTLVNGGLIFRNMAAVNAEDTRFVGLTKAYLTATHLKVEGTAVVINDSETDTYPGYLYINPIIGRVIAGYAFYEGAAYHATEKTATLKNGTKNYSISDLSLSAGKLTVTRSGSNFNITVPDGQAMYVLGAIVNSGAAAASYNASTEQVYPALSAFWQAYRAHTAVRGGAAYTAVGNVGYASEPDYTQYAVNDSYTSTLVKVPYIIRAYTNKVGSVYPARAITSATENVITVTGNCDVAAGFRGIGSIYLDKTTNNNSFGKYTQLGITKMTGQKGSTKDSYTITLHMDYREYNHKSVSSYIASVSTTTNDNAAGFGLFNRLNMSSSSSDNSVQYLTLSGSVFYDVYTIDGVPANCNFTTFGSNDRSEATGAINNNTEDVTFRKTILSVGGLAGVMNAKAYIKNVTFDNLSVEGAKAAGGLIGFIHIGDSTDILQIEYESGVTNAGYVNVRGGLQAGGLIGRVYRTQVDILGAPEGTDIIIKNIESKNTDPDETGMTYFANVSTGVGGIIGTCWATDKKNNGASGTESNSSYTLETGASISSRKLFITNINVVKGANEANVRVLNNNGDDKTNYAGGFLGSAHNAYIRFKNCKLEGVKISANTAGGFIGKVTQKYYLEIIGCSANGSAKAVSVKGTRFAGGAVGWAIGRDYLYFQLLDFSIQDYKIESTTAVENLAGAGGVLGYAEGNNKSVNDGANYICQFNNLAVLNCEIKTNYDTPGDNGFKFKVGTGGIIGVIDTMKNQGGTDGMVVPNRTFYSNTANRTTSNRYKFSGYNILIKDCTLIHLVAGDAERNYSIATGTNKNRCIGDIVGNNAVQTTLKLVGVSVENTGYYVDSATNAYCGKHVGYYNSDNDNYGSGGNYGSGYAVFANFNGVTGNVDVTGLTISNPVITADATDGIYQKVTDNTYTVTVSQTCYRKYIAATDSGLQRYNFSGSKYVVADENGVYVIDDVGYVDTVNGIHYRLYNEATDDGLTRYYIYAPKSVENASGAYVRCEEADARYFVEKEYFKAWTSGVKYQFHSGFVGSEYYSNADVVLKYPYVTINPSITIGNIELTGDGIADSVENLPIMDILTFDNAGKVTGYKDNYKYAANAYYTGSSGDRNYAAFSASIGKLVLFNSEATDYLGTNFPVLVVDDTNHANSHKLVNSYLRLLTNTKHDFGVDGAGEYEVAIYNMVYEDGAWTTYAVGDLPQATDPSLKRKDGQFYMSANAFDSGKTQFSLIDVRFYDPADQSATKKIAYHLYVPVFVKKVLSYQFDIAVHSGTDYLKNTYTSHFGEALIENIGTPITFFFRYTYSKVNAEAASESPLKTTAEWQEAILAGENTHWNYPKELQFYKANQNATLKDLPDDTILVLIDPNDGGKPYYAKLREFGIVDGERTQIGGALWGNQLELSRFKDTMTKDGSGNITFSGSSFEPLKLDELMTLTATENPSGTMMTCPDNEATVMIGAQGYRPITTDDSPSEKYNITVADSPILEQYYISVFTESNVVNDALFHYYLVQPRAALEAEGCPPSRITDTNAHTMVHLIMGKIFKHENLTLLSDPEDNGVVMSEDNNTLTVDMSIELGISSSLGELVDQLKPYIRATQVYQGFLVYLNRVEGLSSYKAILGDPSGAGSYYLNSDSAHSTNYYAGSDPTPPSGYDGGIEITQNMAQFRTGDLSSQFASGDAFVLHSRVTLTYDGGAIPTQFPGRNSSSKDNGAWVSASSNIAFTENSVTNSKNSVQVDESPKKTFYSEAIPDVATLDLNPVGDRVGDFTPLGINAANNDGRNAESFDLYAVLDVATVADLVADYADASIVVTLGRKGDDGIYTTVSDISQYLTIKLADRSTFEDIVSPAFALSLDRGSYSTVVAKSLLADNGVEITLPLLRFTVKTGASLEAEDLTYGNYCVNVAVELRDDEGTVYQVSHAANFVIYSNVRVIPSFLDN